MYELDMRHRLTSTPGLNIEVTGSGTAVPEGVVGTKLYTVDEDGIIFNPYASTITYNIPGPKLWDGAGSGSSPTTPTTPTTPTNGTASAAPSASAPAASATPVKEDTPAPSASAVATPVASPAPSTGAGESSGDLPTEFTLETFIAWLEGKAAGSSSKARRHARSFF